MPYPVCVLNVCRKSRGIFPCKGHVVGRNGSIVTKMCTYVFYSFSLIPWQKRHVCRFALVSMFRAIVLARPCSPGCCGQSVPEGVKSVKQAHTHRHTQVTWGGRRLIGEYFCCLQWIHPNGPSQTETTMLQNLYNKCLACQ